MSIRGSKVLRRTTNTVLDALLHAAEAAHHGKPMTMAELHDIVAGLKTSPQFEGFFHRAYGEVVEVVEAEKLEQKRHNAFGRLMVHQLSELFDQGVLDRDILPNIFSFFHLVLGDDAEAYGQHCQEIVRNLRDEMGEEFSWHAFYHDPRAELILWRTLTRIAASFKRWDLRKDWFMKLMQYTPSTVSVGPSAFVIRGQHDHGEERKVFGEHEFCAFFQALFGPVMEMDKAAEDRFRKEFGTDPHHLIGPFLVHLAACGG
jgi:hypothetical protein